MAESFNPEKDRFESHANKELILQLHRPLNGSFGSINCRSEKRFNHKDPHQLHYLIHRILDDLCSILAQFDELTVQS